ncbi:hypothetical protein [Pandoraea pneumonica]|uniref:hypothetical protein n=1 Tax=Pandoraea pneumonica TaxID=2508299 RepID=UPI00123F2BFD|nr:hypothetical protein [Pandoraea pneumonica]
MAYIYQSGIISPRHVWLTENQVLAIKFRNRLINTKDISSINAFSPTSDRMYMAVTVQLRSGETLTETYLKRDAYENAGPQWVACTLNKVCADLVRAGVYGVPDRFPGMPPFLANVSESEAEQAGTNRASKDAATIAENMVVSRGLSGAIPNFAMKYNIKFGEIREISNLEPLVRRATRAYASSPTSAARWQQEHEAQDANRRRALMQYATTKLRQSPSVGAGTNCGPIFEIRLPKVGVITVAGPKFIALADLYAPGVACYIVSGKYDSVRTKMAVESQ